MIIRMADRLFHMRRFRSGVRRGLAAALSLTLVLPMTATFAAGMGDSALFPVKVATPEEFPDIEIEGNFVRDEFGFLTGYYELGLRVKTPESGSFMGLGVVLEYDTSVLTPVDWSEQGADVTITDVGYYGAQLPTQKLEDVSTATAHSGEPTAEEKGEDFVGEENKALMSFVVNSYRELEFPGGGPLEDEPTTLAVVRFRVDEQVMENVSISKNKSGGYDVKYGDESVTDVAGLYKAMQSVTPELAVRVVEFAPDKDIKNSGEKSGKLDVHMALDYLAGYEDGAYTNEYYHIPGYDPDDKTTFESPTEIIEGRRHSFDKKPKTENNLILAVDPDCSNPDTPEKWGDGKYSYVSNLIVNTKDHTYISFPIVSKRSFTDQADTLGNLTTIVYVDWDNTLLGTQTVPKNSDIRQLVSDYVAENFIYHDGDEGTYGPNDLNDPLQAGDPAAAVSSLKRVDNYRGKYTANGPALESVTDGTVVDNGADYPLTNKLDYVFFKRPMTHTVAFDDADAPKPDVGDNVKYPGGTADSRYIADLAAYQAAYDAWYWAKTEWSQQTDEDGKPVWDTERPYAYGWAECTIDNYEDVWTTLGMGELGSTAAVDEAGAGSAAKGYNGASLGGYQAIPSGTVASVTYDGDADFAFADLSKGFDKNTVFLKAVYEPGEGLLDGSSFYRMSHAPYYNKFNYLSAQNGGAYSVSVSFERANTDDTAMFLHGVARLRDPVIRQDTTADLKWEESTTPLVSHNLANATWDETYTTKSKTTYTQVGVSNTEEISAEMAFSARQNKLDFFLSENYQSNFVAAGSRTDPNPTRGLVEYTADNYNYYTGDTTKVPTAYYAPSVYSDREGTYGFVLFGTLNYLMEQATGYAQGTVDSDSFYNTVKNSLGDANLRDSTGNSFSTTDYATITGLMEKLKQAALAAKGHQGDPNYWNDERNCAELTYHQLQLYMNDSNLRSRADADAQTIRWCHLHSDCAALMSGKPRNHKELVQKAVDGNRTDIEKLNPEEIKETFHLRTKEGSETWSSAVFADEVVKAVKKLTEAEIDQNDITWDQLQYVLIEGEAIDGDAMNAHGAEHYWWYDGKSVSTFADVVLAADAASANPQVEQTLPDGRAVKNRKAKLNQIQPAFPADPNEPGQDWLTYTENLTKGQNSGDAGKVDGFDSFDSFVSAIVSAVEEVGVDAGWHEVQHAILDPGACQGPSDLEHDGYWWHNGGVNITDLASLLKAAQKGGSAWAGYDFSAFSALNNAKLHLAADLAGSAVTADNYAAVKSAIAAYANTQSVDLSNNAWDAVQSTIINGGTYASRNVRVEQSYYWWRDGTTSPGSIDFTLSGSTNGARADELAKKLSEAYFKVAFNGYGEEQWNALTAEILEAGRLVKSQNGGETTFPTDFNRLSAGDIDTVKAAVKELFEAVNGVGRRTPTSTDAYTAFDWTSLQAKLMEDLSPSPEYWWKEKDSKGNSPQQDFQALQAALSAYIESRDPDDLLTLQDAFTLEKARNMGFIDYNTLELVEQDRVEEINDMWETIIDGSEPDAFDMLPLTWKQIQFMIISADYIGDYLFMNQEMSVEVLDEEGITPPEWVASIALRTPFALAAPQAQTQTRRLAAALAGQVKALEEDPDLRAGQLEDGELMKNLQAYVERLGFELVPKSQEEAPGRENTYAVDPDTAPAVPEDIETDVDNAAAGAESAAADDAGDKAGAAPEEEAAAPNDTETDVDSTAADDARDDAGAAPEEETAREEEDAPSGGALPEPDAGEAGAPAEAGPEDTVTTSVTMRVLKTGRGGGLIMGASWTGADPPPWWWQRRGSFVLTTVADNNSEGAEIA